MYRQAPLYRLNFLGQSPLHKRVNGKFVESLDHVNCSMTTTSVEGEPKKANIIRWPLLLLLHGSDEQCIPVILHEMECMMEDITSKYANQHFQTVLCFTECNSRLTSCKFCRDIVFLRWIQLEAR